MPEISLRSGFTTGTCAAAATKAAIFAWLGGKPDVVEVLSPQGRVIQVPVASCQSTNRGGRAVVVKDAGDDPDITNGATVVADIEIIESPDLILRAGAGVGTVTKPGLSVPVGEPAINPGPRQMIALAAKQVLPPGKGAIITISVPGGEKLAQKTLNPVLGIVGGLSIIGTTGIVEPMSEEAFKKSLRPQISVVKALGYESVVFVPGKIGHDIAVRCGLPEASIVQTSNFIGYMLESAVAYGMKEVLILGHPGKVVKLAAGIFHTHNRVADARMETIAAYLAADGAPQQAIRCILDCATTEAAIDVINDYQLHGVYPVLAGRASIRAQRYVFGELKVGVVMVTLQGEILGHDANAREIGAKLGWNLA
ncbi:MAG: cobalt-precorrin-5B (C(1))-methyltransferase CbiD [Negativicutes bacterium]|nr:cobalt-precorrin-5B (C(1))-methyltransferase CbiD [Negativicutes bacterium]